MTNPNRLTRRNLLKSAAGLGSGALLLGLPGNLDARDRRVRKPTRPVASYRADVANAWHWLALQLIQETPGFTPPVVSRALGYIGVTLYEAVQPGMPGYQSLAGQLNDLTEIRPADERDYYWSIVANSALAASVRYFFPNASAEGKQSVTDLEIAILRRSAPGLSKAVIERSVQRGRAVADHIYDWSIDDGGHEGYGTNFPTDYTPPVGVGLWVPTPPAFQSALQPYWDNNRPFLLGAVADHDPGPPPAFSTEPGSAFYNEAREVYEAVNNLTEEQRDIAVFWADDPGQTPTPPGHSISILVQVLEDRRADLALAAEAYVRAGIAVADAFICCWHSKFQYNLIRPISYIQQHIDGSWGVDDRALPVTTPPFPEYTSGHSVQTAVFAQVLYDLFGDFPFTDHTHDARGLPPRSYSSCLEMAEETAISRLYGGIHFRSAIEYGIEQGNEIGRRVSALELKSPEPVPFQHGG